MDTNRPTVQMRHADGGQTVGRSAESDLDALLQIRENRLKAAETENEAPPDPVEVFRRSLEDELIPVLEELAHKYVTKGVVINWDVADLLAGGRELTFDFVMLPHRTTMHGTVARDVMAFQVTRYVSETGGEVSSGPMLPLRSLTQTRFREFLCEQITQMVRFVLRTSRR